MNTISLSRLKNLFIEYIILNWKRDLIVFGIFFLLNILSGYYSKFDSLVNSHGAVWTVMIILLSRLFKFVENKHRKINYFLTPANIKEKFTANILISHLYFPLLVIIPIVLGFNAGRFISAFYDHSIFTFYDVELLDYSYILFLFGIQSIFMFGALFFKKRGVLKTFLCLIGLFIIGVIIVFRLFIVLDLIRPNNSDDFVFVLDKLFDNTVFASIFQIINYLVILFFWTLSYFRLKRMEV